MESIDHYVVQGELARGAMGVVYRAHDPNLGRDVAIKVILDAELAGPVELARFKTEAQVMARLRHPNVVPILGAGAAQRRPYLVLELVEGESLAARLKRSGRLPPHEAVRIALGVAEALGHAHQLGIVHRDVKPENILLDRYDKPRVTDFGVAKVLGVEKGLTVTGEVLGTPHYMAPESAQGDKHLIGPATDVYAVGAVLFKMLTGDVPHPGGSMLEILDKVITSPTPHVRERAPEIDPELDALCAQAMAKEIEQRFVDGDALAARLAEWQPAPAAARSDPLRLILAATVGIAVGLTLGLSIQRSSSDQATAGVGRVAEAQDRAAAGHEAEHLDSAKALVREARTLAERNRPRLGLRLLEQAGRLSPGLAEVHATRGFAMWVRDGNQVGGPLLDEHLAKAAALDPEGAFALLLRARSKPVLPTSERVALLKRAVQLEPQVAWLQLALAVDCKWLANKQAATAGVRDALDRALELNPEFLEVLLWRSRFRQEHHDLSGALRDADQAVQSDPGGFKGYLRRGELHWFRAKAGAKAAVDKLLLLATRDHETAERNAERLGKREKQTQALCGRLRLMGLHIPRLANVNPNGAVRYQRDALNQANQALRSTELRGNPDLLFLKGELCNALRRWEEAAQAFKEVIQRDPKQAYEAQMQRARTLASHSQQLGWKGKLAEAVAEYRKAEARASQPAEKDRAIHARVRLVGISAAERAGGSADERRRAALQEIDQRLLDRPRVPKLLALKAELHQALGELPAALRALEAAVDHAENPARRQSFVRFRDRIRKQLR